MDLIFDLVALLCLLLLSGFFSLAETAMLAANRHYLSRLARQGHKGAKKSLQLLEKSNDLLSSLLLGNNLVNAVLAAFSTLITVELFGQQEWALAVATMAITFLILIFSEITPKIIGASYGNKLAIHLGWILQPVTVLMRPAVWFLSFFVNRLLKILRLRPQSILENSRITWEEIKTLVREVQGESNNSQQVLLSNVIDLDEVRINEVMVEWNRVSYIDITWPVKKLRSALSKMDHARVPVCQGSNADIVGFLRARDIHKIMVISDDQLVAGIQSRLEAVMFIPSGAWVLQQLERLKHQHCRMAVVVNEYGESLGIVTVEDMIEEIVGEFTTESSSQQTSNIRQEAAGVYVVSGTTLLRLINRQCHIDLPTTEASTVNGLIQEITQELPQRGQKLWLAEGVQAEVLAVRHNRVLKVRLRKR